MSGPISFRTIAKSLVFLLRPASKNKGFFIFIIQRSVTAENERTNKTDIRIGQCDVIGSWNVCIIQKHSGTSCNPANARTSC